MDEKVEEPQEQAADRPALRDVSPKKLAKILEAHRKWVESEGKEGERADLNDANLQKANLYGANLQGAYLREAEGLTASQVKTARNWELAFYSKDFLKELGLKPDHNERVKKKLAEMEKEKKATGAK